MLFLALSHICAFGQNYNSIGETLTGSWDGAFIKGNSYQKIQIEFSQKEGKVFGLQIMEEWHPSYGEFQVPVEIDSIGKIRLATGYGEAELVLDVKNLELIGQLKDQNPSIYLHFKKTAEKPKPDFSVEEVSISNGEISLSGHHHIPSINVKKTAIIIVGGRGCYAGSTKYNLYAKFLRKYGMSVLVYNKRGTGLSSGDCGTATMEDMAKDLISAKQFLANHQNGYEKIGVLGTSAGGWTMLKGEELTDFDFMISIVGPSTSVKDQQLQSMAYGADVFKLSQTAKRNVEVYTEMMFSAKTSQGDFDKMNDLLLRAEKENWKQLLEDTDIPQSVAGIEQLWVRRHNYDPKSVLSAFNNPYLAIYGERDWIVPPGENISLLKSYFADRPDLLTVVEAYNAEHGMEMEAKWIDLSAGRSYWHFYRISPEVRIEIVDFLRKHELVD
ncbi:alpha/beta hydrolase [Muriicola soli]|uniref:Alpha/beta hydrolase n=1 Tax=Muriicola soli TaxID=2507538 RepID=A0A411E8Q4_9FLAO|nr:alpha/beta hydrolase [Muriicola soli]QBA64028.1 alpha/beta hydrolase [Muriicola soli]